MGDLSGADAPHFLDRADHPRIAVRFRAGRGPALMFLPGYASDMLGTKAVALDDWAARTGHAMLRFDYAGTGESGGSFEEGTLASWRDDALAVLDATEGDVVLVGSSMGGWLMLLVAQARPDRVRALVGLAAAPDFTEWGYSAEEKAAIQRDGRMEQPSPYGAPMVTTHGFWQSGEGLKQLHGPIAYDGPVRLIQGEADPEVPVWVAGRIAALVRSADVQTLFIKDGDHRLSRQQDIALLVRTIEMLMETL